MSLHNADSSVFIDSNSSLIGHDSSGLYTVRRSARRRKRRELVSEQERPEFYQDANDTYPLVALKNMVVFPRTRMTLAIAREKSVRAVEEAMMRPDHFLVAAAQRDPDIEDPQPKDIYATGALV